MRIVKTTERWYNSTKMQLGVTQKMKLYNVYRLCKNNIEKMAAAIPLALGGGLR